jgi:hypothetical protein
MQENPIKQLCKEIVKAYQLQIKIDEGRHTFGIAL